MKIYAVGGQVRDQLLGLEPKDKDYVVVGSTPEEMLSLGFTQVGNTFPVFLHPESGCEYALARTEKKNGVGYQGFDCYFGPEVTIEEDLLRRDLTINAMAIDEKGNLVDPHGGQRDIKNKLLRPVSEHFMDDPLRALRAARFAARYNSMGFRMTGTLRDMMHEVLVTRGEWVNLTGERVWKEIESVLNGPSPWIFFDELYEVLGLDIAWFPLQKQLDEACYKLYPPEVKWAIVKRYTVDFDLVGDDYVPASFKKVVQLDKVFKASTLEFGTTEDVLDTYRNIDAFRNPKNLDLALMVSDTRETLWHLTILWVNLLREVSAINNYEIKEMGFTGKSFGDKLREIRLDIIKAYRDKRGLPL